MILGPVLVGLYWRRRRPASQFGPLLILAGLVGGVPYVLQSSISVCAAACPPDGLLIATEPAFVVDVVRVVRILVILVALAAAVLIVMRVVRGTPPRRRALAIGAPVALAFLVSQAACQPALLFELQAGDFYGVIQWTIVTRSSIWYGVLFALIAAELYAGRVLRRVVVASLRRPAAVHAGVGLRNMEDRLGAVQGRLTIVTSPGKGTRISGRVPVNGTVP